MCVCVCVINVLFSIFYFLNSGAATFISNISLLSKVLQYTGGHDLFSIGRRRSPAVSTADIPLLSQGAFFQNIHASEPEH